MHLMHFLNMKKKTIKKQNVDLNTKHIRLRVLAFIVAVCIALGGFGYGIYLLVNSNASKEGWNTYSLNNYRDVKYDGYDENIYLNYYFNSNAKSNSKKVVTLFVNRAKKIYSLIDSNKNHQYDENGIAYINNHPGEKIEINKILFDILLDAKEKTYRKNSSYSMFSGLIQDYWKYFIANVSLTNYKEPEYLDMYVEYSNDLSNYNLELEKENERYFATFTISENLNSFIEENKLEDVSILDLNVLFYSYYLQNIYDEFKKEDLTKGYLYTQTGEMILMSNDFVSGNGIKIYDTNNYYSLINCGIIDSSNSAYVSSIRTFPIFDGYASKYFYIKIPNINPWSSRSLFYDYRVGYNKTKIKTSTIIEEDMNTTLEEVTFNNLNIVNSEDINNYDNLINNTCMACGILKDEDKTIYLHNAKDYYKDTYTEEGEKISYIKKEI